MAHHITLDIDNVGESYVLSPGHKIFILADLVGINITQYISGSRHTYRIKPRESFTISISVLIILHLFTEIYDSKAKVLVVVPTQECFRKVPTLVFEGIPKEQKIKKEATSVNPWLANPGMPVVGDELE